MRRWRLVAVLLALYVATTTGLVWLLAGFIDDEEAKSAPGPVLVAVTKPSRDTSMFQGQYTFIDERGLYYFVVDVESGELYGIRDLCFRKRSELAPSRSYACQIHSISWLDNDTVRVEVSEPLGIRHVDQPVDNAVYHADLSGKVRRTIEPLLRLQQPEARVVLTWSADGRWNFGGEGFEAGEMTTTVVRGAAPNAYLITSAPQSLSRWSPTESKLALIGNYCVDRESDQRFDLFIFDAAKGELANLTEAVTDGILFYEWNPTGESIAATGIHFGEGIESNKLLLLNPDRTEQPRTLLDFGRLGFFVPAGWNPDGTRLLIKFFGGTSWCTGPGSALPPTSLQVRPERR